MSKDHLLYSFIRCPYAIRARMALAANHIPCVLREINLKDKAERFLQDSPKGTVPVLIRSDGVIVDESLDIVHYAFKQEEPSPPHPLLQSLHQHFIPAVQRYKYQDPYAQEDINTHFKTISPWLLTLEETLKDRKKNNNNWQAFDCYFFPFVRQCYKVDINRFNELDIPHVKQWLDTILNSPLFNNTVMKKIPVWSPGKKPILLASKEC
jgi:glutathione S-transferase